MGLRDEAKAKEKACKAEKEEKKEEKKEGKKEEGKEEKKEEGKEEKKEEGKKEDKKEAAKEDVKEEEPPVSEVCDQNGDGHENCGLSKKYTGIIDRGETKAK